MKIQFTQFNKTLWWTCPGCGRKVHLTRQSQIGILTGVDFLCSQGCTWRHCAEWPSEQSATSEAEVYSYDPRNCDFNELPLLARL